MTNKEIGKLAGTIVVKIGVGSIISNAIKATTPTNTGLLGKVCIVAGSVVLTNMIGDAAVEYAERKIKSLIGHVEHEIHMA